MRECNQIVLSYPDNLQTLGNLIDNNIQLLKDHFCTHTGSDFIIQHSVDYANISLSNDSDSKNMVFVLLGSEYDHTCATLFDHFHKLKNPQNKLFIYFESKHVLDQRLIDFKISIEEEYKHFYAVYNNEEQLCYNIIEQMILLMDIQNISKMFHYKRGAIFWGDKLSFNISKLSFIKCNNNYSVIRNHEIDIISDIQWYEEALSRKPDNINYQSALTFKKNQLCVLEEQITRELSFVMNASLHITQLRSQRTSERIRLAAEHFDQGRIHEALSILEPLEDETNEELSLFIYYKQIRDDNRQCIIDRMRKLQAGINSLIQKKHSISPLKKTIYSLYRSLLTEYCKVEPSTENIANEHKILYHLCLQASWTEEAIIHKNAINSN